MTEGEHRLWGELRDFRHHYGLHVRRQAPIGPYIVDFAIHSIKLAIEVDGEHHQLPDRRRRDELRDGWLKSVGYNVLRINTGELEQNFDGCVETILHACGLMKP
tara:strand:+ start:1254 stop:1565 length:312 start_codon:yes stop_codon:yes gene_type:complete